MAAVSKIVVRVCLKTAACVQSFQRSESSSVSIILFSSGLFAEAIVPITLYNATIAAL